MSTEKLVLLLAERDYMYGTGELALRVRHVEREAPLTYDNELWYYVHGTQLGHEGRVLGDRVVVVRGRRLSAAGVPLN
ncbi:hypothetical protein Dvina_29850 [Dactylosporangium vinaceum]|uniref:Uncharacterized protein n=1 Tax=Dactylosporangium vinaceum TaxID=53362 RepID=A0ABV5MDZ7_9ACTN|nr:hypothetical protein [Dactylosporangium vinaceum]UAB92545.1 hypothetical protein Dvina_29850 [Dactylosporangium vinaceum]